jgi:predicted AAA+ superfamily ATPase
LQHIKQDLNLEETLYVTAEHFYFADNRLFDLAENFVKRGGKYLFIDEIHKYKEWSRELKLIYDLHPKLNVIFTGSSVLDIVKGSSDLSRRAVMYAMQGLSFREYLQFFHGIEAKVFSLDEVLAHKSEISGVEHPLPLFDDYLQRGYYPFAKFDDYDIRLQQIVNQVLEGDIPLFAEMNMAVGRKLKQMLAIIAKSVPFKPNFSKIAGLLGVSRNNIADYCLLMEEAGLISQLRNSAGGIRSLGKVEKVYLDNTNLIHALASENANIGNLRETFFVNQLRLNHDVVSSPISDFEVDSMTFEIGGKSKEQKQIQAAECGFVVKDNIEFGYENIIPLWHFGLMY